MCTFYSYNSKCTKGYTAKNQPNLSLSSIPINQFFSLETRHFLVLLPEIFQE